VHKKLSVSFLFRDLINFFLELILKHIIVFHKSNRNDVEFDPIFIQISCDILNLFKLIVCLSMTASKKKRSFNIIFLSNVFS